MIHLLRLRPSASILPLTSEIQSVQFRWEGRPAQQSIHSPVEDVAMATCIIRTQPPNLCHNRKHVFGSWVDFRLEERISQSEAPECLFS